MIAVIPGWFLFATACSGPSVAYLWYPPKTDLKTVYRNGGRIILFDLPSFLAPEEKSAENLLPNRSGEPIYSGLDVLALDNFSLLRNRNFALLTNGTGVDRKLRRGIDLLHEAGVDPALVLEPEHGLFGYEEGTMQTGIRRDPTTGLRILSLYSMRRQPDCSELSGIDVIVVDLFHLPVRAYTYASTLIELMQSAMENRIEIMILDRANPYGLWNPEGPMLDLEYESFVGKAPVPFLYSMTPGELSLYLALTRFPRLKLSVVRVSGYSREEKDAPLRTSWVNPSPNIPGYDSALVYPGVVLFEGTNVSLGRGTTRPFVYSGAPWMNSDRVVEEMRKLHLPGVEFTQAVFQPSASLYAGQVCRGVQITPTTTSFDPIRTGYEYMRIIHRLHPEDFRITGGSGNFFMDRLWGGSDYRRAVEADVPYEDFRNTWKNEALEFTRLAEPAFLYGEPEID